MLQFPILFAKLPRTNEYRVVDMFAGALQKQFRSHSEYFGLVQGIDLAYKQEKTTLKNVQSFQSSTQFRNLSKDKDLFQSTLAIIIKVCSVWQLARAWI
jgi:16S rRNA G966 N2-methylase RsmD